MEFPKPLISQASGDLLLPPPICLFEPFGVSLDSTEALLSSLFTIAKQEAPVDPKTLKKAANGGTKWSTKQKIAQPLLEALKEMQDQTLIEGIGIQDIVPDLAEYLVLLEKLLEQPNQQQAEACLKSESDSLDKVDCSSVYQDAARILDLLSCFNTSRWGQSVSSFLKNRVKAQAQLEDTTNQAEFRNIFKANTLLSEEIITMIYEVQVSGNHTTSQTLNIQLFMDFFSQLVACIEIDIKHLLFVGELGDDFFIQVRKPGAFSQLIAKSIELSRSEPKLNSLLLHLGRMHQIIKNDDDEVVGMKRLAQYMPDATKSDKKPSERDSEDIANNKYRMLCTWYASDIEKRKRPKDETLRGFLDNFFRESAPEASLIFFHIFKMALAFEDIFQNASFHQADATMTSRSYLDYYAFTITRLEQQTDDGGYFQL